AGGDTANPAGGDTANPAGESEKISSLQKLVSEASQNPDDPSARAHVKQAVLTALNDKSIPFREIRDLIDGGPPAVGGIDYLQSYDGPRSTFDFARGQTPDPEVVQALQNRAIYEVEHNPNAFTDNKAALQAVIDDVRQNGDKLKLERDVTNSIDPSLTPEEKAAALLLLAQQNEPLLNQFFAKIDDQFGSHSVSDVKSFGNILNKAVRGDVLEKANDRDIQFQVEHIRDSVRGKIVLNDISDLPTVFKMLQDEGKEQGFQVIKAEPEKFATPTKTGWRNVQLDLLFDNGQIGEVSVRVRELEDVPDNHQDYEIIRTSAPNSPEFKQAIRRSNGIFDQAYRAYLERTGQTEDDVRRYLNQVSLLHADPDAAALPA
ncbi:MAG TPA: hypothetical protein V6C72_13645, partial [Chroococcales cyanobacterium]